MEDAANQFVLLRSEIHYVDNDSPVDLWEVMADFKADFKTAACAVETLAPNFISACFLPLIRTREQAQSASRSNKRIPRLLNILLDFRLADNRLIGLLSDRPIS
jgi:hypothetical protein